MRKRLLNAGALISTVIALLMVAWLVFWLKDLDGRAPVEHSLTHGIVRQQDSDHVLADMTLEFRSSARWATQNWLGRWERSVSKHSMSTDTSGRFNVVELLNTIDVNSLDDLSCFALPWDNDAWTVEHAKDQSLSTNSVPQALESFEPAQAEIVVDDTAKSLTVHPPELADVVIAVRNPDGQLLRRRPVHIYPCGYPFTVRDTLRLSGETDDDGNIRLRWWSGVYRWIVVVPDVGFGSTGYAEVLPNQESHIPLPSLAGFGELRGRLDGFVNPRGTVTIEFSDWSDRQVWAQETVPVQRDGTFKFQNVFPGRIEVTFEAGDEKKHHAYATVVPGETREVVIEKPVEIRTRTYVITPGDTSPPRVERTSSISGIVRDHDGRPLAGRQVFVLNRWSGARRRVTNLHMTETGPNGRYRFDELKVSHGPDKVIVIEPGRPMAIVPVNNVHLERVERVKKDTIHDTTPGTLQAQEAGLIQETLHYKADVTLSDQSGTLEVQIRPSSQRVSDVSDAGDAIQLLGPELFDPFTRGIDWQSEAAQTLVRALNPIRRVGTDGRVRFANLAPGRYGVVPSFDVTEPAIEQAATQRPSNFRLWDQPDRSEYRDITVAAGEVRRFHVARRPAIETRPTELFVGRERVSTQKLIQSNYSWSPTTYTSNQPTRNSGEFAPPTAGLWYFVTQFRRSQDCRNSSAYGPSFSVQTVVASSSLLAPTPIRMNAHHRDSKHQSLTVHLRDQHGQPLAGTLRIGQGFAATTTGTTIFEGMPFDKRTVQAHVPGQVKPPLPTAGQTDNELSGHVRIQPVSFQVGPEQPQEVVLQEQPVSYIRCHLKFADGVAPKSYSAKVSSADGNQHNFHLDRDAGTVLAGPISDASAVVTVYADGEMRIEQEFQLEPGRVLNCTLDVPQASNGVVPSGNAIGRFKDVMCRRSDRTPEKTETVPVHVRHADGTPAEFALVDVFVPGRTFLRSIARTDKNGRTEVPVSRYRQWWEQTLEGAPLVREIDTQPDDGTPEIPVLMASLPGSHGATILPLTRALAMQNSLEITLPPRHTIAGRVAVECSVEELADTAINLQVRYRGLGKLNDRFSFAPTAEADGSFRIDGLTPGTYDIQAAIDGIWLTDTVTIEVPSEPTEFSEVVLSAGRPGATGLVRLVWPYADETPLKFQDIHVEFPAGPLTKQIRSSPLQTDGTGFVRIDGCRAGTNTFRLKPGSESIRFHVPPYDSPNISVQSIPIDPDIGVDQREH